MIRSTNIFTLLSLLVVFSNCKKNQFSKIVAVETKFETNIKPLSIFKIDVLKAGLEGYSYGYPDIKVVNDGELLIVASRFESIDDNTEGGHLISIRSFDKGTTWTAPEVIQENIAKKRTGAPSIIKITDRHLILTFSAHHSTSEIDLHYKESFDAGYSWSDYSMLSTIKGYNVCNNSASVFQNNQITVPVAFVAGEINRNYDKQFLYFYTSDDLGKSWQYGNAIIANFALMEPYINTFADGEAMVNARTKYGYIYIARKMPNQDWVLYNTNINSPASPQKIFKYSNSDKLVMLWNNTDKKEAPNRSPLSIAVSEDKAYSWVHIYDIENTENFDFAYSAIDADNEYLYLSYYKRPMNTSSRSRSSLVFCRLNNEEL